MRGRDSSASACTRRSATVGSMIACRRRERRGSPERARPARRSSAGSRRHRPGSPAAAGRPRGNWSARSPCCRERARAARASLRPRRAPASPGPSGSRPATGARPPEPPQPRLRPRRRSRAHPGAAETRATPRARPRGRRPAAPGSAQPPPTSRETVVPWQERADLEPSAELVGTLLHRCEPEVAHRRRRHLRGHAAGRRRSAGAAGRSRRDAAAAVHHDAARRSRALPDRLRPRARLGRRADRRPAPHRRAARPPRSEGVGHRSRRAGRRARHVPADDASTIRATTRCTASATACRADVIERVPAADRVVAVGTTAVRALESAAAIGELRRAAPSCSSTAATTGRSSTC